jgi:3'(2'), 5'-bisphosphate nucleotidase
MTDGIVLNILKNLATQAGQAIMGIYATDFAVKSKEDNSPVTIADQTANDMIIQGLKKYFPEYAILSEEAKDDLTRLMNDYCFLVDPLDGTKEFVERNGQFTVSIALTYKNRAVLGVIYAPVTQQLYYAAKGDGAYLKDLATGAVKKLSVTNKLNELIWVGSKSHSSANEEELIAQHRSLISKVIQVGSSLKGCMVAEGKADVYYRFGATAEWDTAAMQCIVEAAGGICRQMDGSEMLYNRKHQLQEKGFYMVNRKENIWV